MFLNSNLRPVTAGASNEGFKQKRDFSPLMFDGSANASDFGEFGSSSEKAYSERSNYAPKRPSGNGKKGGFSFNKATVIAIVAAALVLLIVVGICASLFLPSLFNPNITYKDNAYMVYADANGAYHVIANGTILEQEFQGEVTITTAADNSFAYVFDDIGDGIVMYLLKGKKLSVLISGNPIEEIMALATLEPGIIYKDQSGSNTNYMLYNESDGEEQIVNDKDSPANFTISGDGKVVAYTTEGNDSASTVLNIYDDSYPEPIDNTEDLIPIAASGEGDYIYLISSKDNTDSLAVYNKKDNKAYSIEGSDGFISILDMNIKGDEVIFAAESDPDLASGEIDSTVNSYLYRYSKNTVTDIGKNYVTPTSPDPTVVVHKTFKNTYFTSSNVGSDGKLIDGATEAEYATYYLNSKYEKEPIREYAGQFSEDGKFFYYIEDGILKQVNLKKPEEHGGTIFTDVESFVITEKGNVYANCGKYINFYKVSSDYKTKASYEATGVWSFHKYSGKYYFAETDDEGNVHISVSENSADKDIAKLDSNELKVVPYFTHQNTKKSYAIVYNEDKSTCEIYYTSSGKKFDLLKKVENCTSVYVADDVYRDAPLEIDLSIYTNQ